jgi:hypothetical protein
MVIYAISNFLDILVIKFCIDCFLLCVLIPIKSYSNAENDKEQILKDNKNKSCVFMWINNLNQKKICRKWGKFRKKT